MNRIMRWSLLSLVVLLGPTGVRVASAQTVNAASCASADVQSALNSVNADGTTVVIPSGTCHWSTPVTYNQVFSTVIQGQTAVAGNCAPPSGTCTATDSTIIYDDVKILGIKEVVVPLFFVSPRSLVSGMSGGPAINTKNEVVGVVALGALNVSEAEKQDVYGIIPINFLSQLS